jgi:chloride channel protein, CIC family
LLEPAILLGLMTGAVSVFFHLSLDYGEALRSRVIDFAHELDTAGPWIIMSLTMIAVFLSAGLAIRFSPEASGSGIPHLKAVLLGLRPFRWTRVLVVKFISMLIGGSAGLMLGREGPTVYMGGAIGQGLANSLPDKVFKERSVLVAAGAEAPGWRLHSILLWPAWCSCSKSWTQDAHRLSFLQPLLPVLLLTWYAAWRSGSILLFIWS